MSNQTVPSAADFPPFPPTAASKSPPVSTAPSSFSIVNDAAPAASPSENSLLAKAGIISPTPAYNASNADDLVSRFSSVSIGGYSPAQPGFSPTDPFAPGTGFYQESPQLGGPTFFGTFDQTHPTGPFVGGYSPQFPSQFLQPAYGQRTVLAPAQYQQYQQYQAMAPQQFQAVQPVQPNRPLPASQILPISRQFTVGPGETLIANKLFVGGLSYDLTEQELVQAFARYGAQKANIICDRETGRSRGYGFVTFDNELSASEAMNFMQGVDVNGRRIRIGPATARAQTRAYQQHIQQQQFQQQAMMMQQMNQVAPPPSYGKGPTGATYAKPPQSSFTQAQTKDWGTSDQGFSLGGLPDFGLAPLAIDGSSGAW